MTIDPHPTPVAEEEATSVPTTDTASDSTESANLATDAPTPELVSADPEAPAATAAATPEASAGEPVAQTPGEPLPGSDPAEPNSPIEPSDPTPAPSAPDPAPTAPVDPQAGAEKAATEVSAANDMDLFESYMSAMDRGDDPEAAIDSSYKRLQKGDRVEATIIQVDRDKVFVDLGTKAEGIIPLGELSEENLDTAIGQFNVGDKISVIVIRPEGAEGNPIVSKKRADFEVVWDRIEEAFRNETMLDAQVVDRVKGGLVVDIGVRGFVPATHVGSGKLRNIEKYVGQTLQLKVIEIDRERKKVVLSNRQAEEERRASAKENIFTAVKPGDKLEGTVRRLTDYGAFVDLGGVDGLLHISEMSWARINHPKEMFKEGQKIEVMVLRLDPSAGKISLGHRQVLPDPWNLIKENYKIGQTLNITIGRIVQSGAFIKLPEGAEAFMPVSEMSFRRIKRPQDVVDEGETVDAQIIDLRPEERRMVLSMRAIGGGAELKPGATEAPGGSAYEQEFRRQGAGGAPGGKRPSGGPGGKGRRDGGGYEEFEDSRPRGVSTGSGATIGERLGMLKGLLGSSRDESANDEGEESSSEEKE
jgi:4-hydroxy-3-methylbut-2-enyl diphosphate reductase